MKGLTTWALGLLLAIFVLGLGLYILEDHRGGVSSQVVNFYNWGDYIDPELLQEFEEETGYRVVYETFDSNEAMVAKLSQGQTSYDLLVPSDYMIERLIAEDLLLPLDPQALLGLENIDPHFLNLSFDPENRFSVPYFWGTLGILYNQASLDQALEEWEDLWSPALRDNLLLFDGAREVLGIGLWVNGQSANALEATAWDQALRTMQTLKPNIRALVADEIKIYMVQEEALAAVTFSGEAVAAMEENSDLTYHVPSQGGNIWFDNLVIPASTTNPAGAYALINFLLRPEIAARNAEYIGYATPNQAARAYLSPETLAHPGLYPDLETLESLEVFEDLGFEALRVANEDYLTFKLLDS